MENNIKEARKSKGLTRDALAELMGTTSTTIYRKESGRRKLNTEEAKRYAEALGVSLSYILGEAEEIERPTTILSPEEYAKSLAYEVNNELDDLDIMSYDTFHEFENKLISIAKKQQENNEPLYIGKIIAKQFLIDLFQKELEKSS